MIVECQYTEWSTMCTKHGNESVQTRKVKETDDTFFGLECNGNVTKACEIEGTYWFIFSLGQKFVLFYLKSMLA